MTQHLQLSTDTVLATLAHHIGARNGIHVTDLTAEIMGVHVAAVDRVNERYVRSIVTELRMQGHHVCAHPGTGYYMAETAEELELTCEWLYDRAMASLRQIAAMKRISMPDLRGQMHLPS